jgi:hypothetical protein
MRRGRTAPGFRCFGLDFIFGHHGSASVITSTFPGASAAR